MRLRRHALPPSTGEHDKHESGGDVVDSSNNIIDPAPHEDDNKDIAGSLTFNASSCSSVTCHGTKSW